MGAVTLICDLELAKALCKLRPNILTCRFVKSQCHQDISMLSRGQPTFLVYQKIKMEVVDIKCKYEHDNIMTTISFHILILKLLQYECMRDSIAFAFILQTNAQICTRKQKICKLFISKS